MMLEQNKCILNVHPAEDGLTINQTQFDDAEQGCETF